MKKVIIAEVVESGVALCISEPCLELEDIKFNKKYNYESYKGLGESNYRYRVFHDLKSHENLSSQTFFRFFRIVTPGGLKSSRGKGRPPGSPNKKGRKELKKVGLKLSPETNEALTAYAERVGRTKSEIADEVLMLFIQKKNRVLNRCDRIYGKEGNGE